MSSHLYLPHSLALPAIFDMVMGMMVGKEADQERRNDAYFLLSAIIERRSATFSVEEQARRPSPLTPVSVQLPHYYAYVVTRRSTYHPAALRLVRDENIAAQPLRVYLECYAPTTDRWETFPCTTISMVEVGVSFADGMTEERERAFAHPVEARAYQAMAWVA